MTIKKITLLLMCWAWCINSVAANLMMAVNHWPPYVDKSHADHGISVELVTAALERKGHRISVQYETWPRVLEGLEVGYFDLVGAVWKTPEREQVMVFSEPYLDNQIKFLKRKDDDIKFNTLEDLTGYFIGIVNDYAYEEEFVKSRRHIKLPQNHIIQNLQRLVQGDIDLTLGDQRAILFEINTYIPNKRNDLVFLEKPLSIRGLRIGVSKHSANAEQIIKDFNSAIIEMKKDGSFQKIIQKYDLKSNLKQ